MRSLPALLAALTLAAPATLVAQAASAVDLKEWAVEWGGRVRDPYVAPDGKVWFVGQQGNYIASFDPATESFRRYTIEEGTNPHNLIVDQEGFVWYAGNRNGRIGKLDPATGDFKTYMTGEARDPHTMMLDGQGNIWFTSQGSNRVGRLNMASGEVDLVVPADQPSNPYGLVMDGEGRPLVALLRAGTIIRIDPRTLALTRFAEGDPGSRSRRLEWTSDGRIWYGDEARGYLGAIDSATGQVEEWAVPGGPGGRPYALTKDDQGRLWFSETGPEKRLIGFDPRTEEFFATVPVSGTIRHMNFDSRTGAMWFGTDANMLGRIMTRTANE